MSEYLEVEKPLLDQLSTLGWSVIDQGEGVPSDPAISLRTAFTQHFLPEVLQESIKRLNPWLSQPLVEQWADRATKLEAGKSLIERNEEAFAWLTKSLLMETDPVTKESKPVRLIDFDNPANNSFHAINQFKIDRPGQLKGIRPDVVLFINGLAVVVIEAKHPLACESPVDEAIEQIRRYSNQRGADGVEGCEDLFVFNALNIATCREQAKYGAVGATSKHYYLWRDAYPESGEGLNAQELLIQSTCKPERLLDIMENFSAVVDEDGFKYKVVTRYQQYRTVHKQLERLRTKTGRARSGTVWHTTGSGKSITMMFLVRKLRRTEDLKSFKVVLVVDRTDLERQLKTTAKIAQETITEVGSRKELETLSSQAPNLNIVMVHKFLETSTANKPIGQTGAVPVFTAFPVVNDSSRIILIVDESHRSQGGSMGDNLFAAFPNAVVTGFTGTPLLKEEKKTTSRFGEYVDIYTPQESIDDGTTVPLRYIGKTVTTAVGTPKSLKRAFENLVADVPDEDRKRIIQKYGTFDSYLEAEDRIDAIAEDIVEHYVTSVFPNGFKAQIVTSSKLAAHRYRVAIEKHLSRCADSLREAGDHELAKEVVKLHPAVVISGDGTNEELWVSEERKRAKELNAIETFKQRFKPDDDRTYLAFLIVCDMLITGFDAPIEQSLYLDKILKEHTLLQTIARANRVAEGKTHGLIIDYIGVLENLGKAFQMYEEAAQRQLLDGIQSVEDEVPRARERFNLVVQFFERRGVKHVYQFLNQDDQAIDKEAIQELMVQALEKQDAREGAGALARLFFQSVDVLLPDPIANQFRPAVQRLGGVLAIAKLRYQERTTSISWAGAKVRALINEHLKALDIDTAIEPIDLLSADFKKFLEKQPGKRAVASTMKHAITKRVRIGIEQGDTWYKPLLEHLEDLIAKYDERWEELIKKLEEIQQKIQEHEEVGNDELLVPAALADCLGINIYADVEKQELFVSLTDRLADVRIGLLPEGQSPYGKPVLQKELESGLLMAVLDCMPTIDIHKAKEVASLYLKYYAASISKS